ncbi:MAG TPA: DNA translocase FtsK 4TM domain-containing protein, partial [Baekduia sp.]|nr:DNA translocase FtsK 4TM domain-containing protein [Baekduia sp.]
MATTKTRSPARAKRTPPKKTGNRRAPARARRSSARRPRLGFIDEHRDLLGLALVAIGVFTVFPLYLDWDGGKAGGALIDGLAYAVGGLRFTAPVAFVVLGAWIVLQPRAARIEPIRAGIVCLTASLAIALAAGTFGLGPSGTRSEFFDGTFAYHHGGYLGEGLLYVASNALGQIGAHILTVFLFLIAAILLTGASLATIVKVTTDSVGEATRSLRTNPGDGPAVSRRPKRVVVPEPEEDDYFEVSARDDEAFEPALPAVYKDIEPEPEAGLDEVAEELQEEQLELPPTPMPAGPPQSFATGAEDEISYELPNSRVLKRSTGDQARPDTTGIKEMGERLIESLEHFNIAAQIVGTVSGPHITRFELRLAPGIKMSKVAQLKDDLAYSLAATEIRILAPIPGKRAVGVEVPNANRRLVHLGDVYSQRPASASPLHVWLGKDVSGSAVGADLAKMPHLLVAGTTGAGKSACINSLLSSVLLGASPHDVRLVLIDPKQVELNHYDSVPHLLTPVITSPRKAANALQNLVNEME